MPASDDTPLDAGTFSAWLDGMEHALTGDADAEVPCGTCTACCRSSQFVHVAPDDVDALAHIPRELLFPAPRAPEGHLLLGYDERGRCPMLRDDGCSIYEHRPRTCRTYDCRVFPATGIEPDGDQAPIAQQARRWRFDLPTETDRQELAALHAAARALHAESHRGDAAPKTPAPRTPAPRTPAPRTPAPRTPAPRTPTQLAVRAVEVQLERR